MKKLNRKQDLEKKLLLKSETLLRLDLSAAAGGQVEAFDGSCFPKTECLLECTLTYPQEHG